MSCAKQALFAAVRWLGVNRCLRAALRRRLLVLCYHGIGPAGRSSDPFSPCETVPLDEFCEQLAVVRRLFTPVSADDVLRCLDGTSRLPDRAVLVTFDDGFRSVLTRAAPEMQRLGVPGVVFVTTGHVGSNRPLWVHQLAQLVAKWPGKSIPAPGGGADLGLPSDPQARCETMHRVVAHCKRLPDEARESYLAGLIAVQQGDPNDDRRPETTCLTELGEFLSWDDVRALKSQGWAIGSHTVDHRILSRLSPEALHRELCQSKAAIEHHTGRPCTLLAYPNGGRDDISSQVIAAAAEAGYRAGFILTQRANRPMPPPLEIDRLSIVAGLSADAFHAWVSGLVAFKQWIRS
jgi:peptidoglycan/xylan/chitin deacetylase (PgdA/CDA1 family)